MSQMAVVRDFARAVGASVSTVVREAIQNDVEEMMLSTAALSDLGPMPARPKRMRRAVARATAAEKKAKAKPKRRKTRRADGTFAPRQLGMF